MSTPPSSRLGQIICWWRRRHDWGHVRLVLFMGLVLSEQRCLRCGAYDYVGGLGSSSTCPERVIDAARM